MGYISQGHCAGTNHGSAEFLTLRCICHLSVVTGLNYYSFKCTLAQGAQPSAPLGLPDDAAALAAFSLFASISCFRSWKTASKSSSVSCRALFFSLERLFSAFFKSF